MRDLDLLANLFTTHFIDVINMVRVHGSVLLPGEQVLFQSKRSKSLFDNQVPFDFPIGWTQITNLNFSVHFSADHRIPC